MKQYLKRIAIRYEFVEVWSFCLLRAQVEDSIYARLDFFERSLDLYFTDMTDEAGVDARVKLYIYGLDGDERVYGVQIDLRTAPDLAYDMLGPLGTFAELHSNADDPHIEDRQEYGGDGVLVVMESNSFYVLVEGDDEERISDKKVLAITVMDPDAEF